MNDLAEIDSKLTNSLRWMKDNNNIEDLQQPFTYEVEVMGQIFTRELIPNGSNIIVTEDNKDTFITRLYEMKIRNEISAEISAFLRGFDLIISPAVLSVFSPSELQLLIVGVPTIDVQEMNKHAEYIGYTKEDDQIKWLWEILGEFSQKELGAFLFFISGTFSFV